MRSLDDYFAALIGVITSVAVTALAILVLVAMIVGALWLITNGFAWLMDGRGL